MRIGMPQRALHIMRGVLIALFLVVLAVSALADKAVKPTQTVKMPIPVLPAVIKATAFRAGGEGIGYHWPDKNGVRIVGSTDTTGNANGGAKVICGINDAWVLYDIAAAKAGEYTVTLRVSNITEGSTLRIELDGKDAAGKLMAPKTGAWGVYADVTSTPVKIAAGAHTLKVIWKGAIDPKIQAPRLHYLDIAEYKPFAIRINAGDYMDYTDSEGNVWQPDTGFADGECTERGEGVIIQNSKDTRIYMTEHFGMSSFSIKVPNGDYIARLHFAETFDDRKPGARIFAMNVQGVDFPKFDLIGEAGGSYRALIKTVPVTVTNGEFRITFSAPNMPSVTINGIELLQAAAPVAAQ